MTFELIEELKMLSKQDKIVIGALILVLMCNIGMSIYEFGHPKKLECTVSMAAPALDITAPAPSLPEKPVKDVKEINKK